MIKRNLLLYFRNHSGVLFSLMGALISFILYLVFLKKSMQSSWSQVPNSTMLLDLWLIGGTLSITSITTTLSSLSQSVIDKEKHITQDLELTDAGPFRLQLSYLLSSTIIGVLMQLIMFVIMLGYFYVADKLTVTGGQFINIFGLMIISSLLATVVNSLIIKYIHKSDNLNKLGTIVGTGAGFLVGTYIPIGSLPNFAQNLVKITPGSYVASLFRQYLMGNKLNNVFKNSVSSRNHFDRLMGIRLEWSHLLTQKETYQIMILIFVGALILLIGSQWLQSRRQVYVLQEK